MMKDWKKEVFTIPNLLSFFRFLLIPVYMSVYLRAAQPRDFYLAGLILALSCGTDLADGWIARRFHMTSQLGAFLDPLADKATQFILTLCLTVRYPVLVPVLCLLVGKEMFQLLASLFYLRRGKVLCGALMAGKICTAVLFVSLILLVIFPDIDPHTVRLISMMDFGFLLNAFVCYFLAFFGQDRQCRLQDLGPNE